MGSFTAKAAKNPGMRIMPITGDRVGSQEVAVIEGERAAGHPVHNCQHDDGHKHQEPADLREQEELHRGTVPVLVSPDVDEEIHRDEHQLPEKSEKEEVEGKEHAVHPGKHEGEIEMEETDAVADTGP